MEGLIPASLWQAPGCAENPGSGPSSCPGLRPHRGPSSLALIALSDGTHFLRLTSACELSVLRPFPLYS